MTKVRIPNPMLYDHCRRVPVRANNIYTRVHECVERGPDNVVYDGACVCVCVCVCLCMVLEVGYFNNATTHMTHCLFVFMLTSVQRCVRVSVCSVRDGGGRRGGSSVCYITPFSVFGKVGGNNDGSPYDDAGEYIDVPNARTTRHRYTPIKKGARVNTHQKGGQEPKHAESVAEGLHTHACTGT